MHDMSNTRKEIAARLGFAAGNGAKESFGRAEDVYRLLETTPSSYNNAKKLDALATEAMRLADITPAGKDVSLHELAEMVGQDLEGDRSRASRPGAKAEFAEQAEYRPGQNVTVLQGNKSVKGVIVKRNDMDGDIYYMVDLPNPLYRDGRTMPQRIAAWKISAARPGTKTVMEKSIDELKKAMDKAVLKHSSISSSSYMAQIKARQPNATPSDIQQAASLKRKTENAWSEWLHARENYRNAVGLPMQSSRPGAKATMTREQTEEQKAGLKIMSAADPAVGAKIAKLIKEGKPQDQAVAIALDMKRRGEL